MQDPGDDLNQFAKLIFLHFSAGGDGPKVYVQPRQLVELVVLAGQDPATPASQMLMEQLAARAVGAEQQISLDAFLHVVVHLVPLQQQQQGKHQEEEERDEEGMQGKGEQEWTQMQLGEKQEEQWQGGGAAGGEVEEGQQEQQWREEEEEGREAEEVQAEQGGQLHERAEDGVTEWAAEEGQEQGVVRDGLPVYGFVNTGVVEEAVSYQLEQQNGCSVSSQVIAAAVVADNVVEGEEGTMVAAAATAAAGDSVVGGEEGGATAEAAVAALNQKH